MISKMKEEKCNSARLAFCVWQDLGRKIRGSAAVPDGGHQGGAEEGGEDKVPEILDRVKGSAADRRVVLALLHFSNVLSM